MESFPRPKPPAKPEEVDTSYIDLAEGRMGAEGEMAAAETVAPIAEASVVEAQAAPEAGPELMEQIAQEEQRLGANTTELQNNTRELAKATPEDRGTMREKIEKAYEKGKGRVMAAFGGTLATGFAGFGYAAYLANKLGIESGDPFQSLTLGMSPEQYDQLTSQMHISAGVGGAAGFAAVAVLGVGHALNMLNRKRKEAALYK